MTELQRDRVTEANEKLKEAFLARRCHCGAPAFMVIPGSDAWTEMGIVIVRAKPDRNLCMVHAGLKDA